MVTPSEKLADSLEALEVLQSKGVIAVRSTNLSRTHRERLKKSGFIKEVIKGWYIASKPDEIVGESTAWYTSYWAFCAQYLNERFGDDWSLSPEQSLLIQAGNNTVPTQLLVRSPMGRNKITNFPHNTSIFEVRANTASGEQLVVKNGLRMFSVEDALIRVTESFFTLNATDARTILATIPDASALLARLLTGGHTRAAGRLVGGFRSIGNNRIADDIAASMNAALHDVRENDPFDEPVTVVGAGRVLSPYVHRIRLMWQEMREDVIANFTPLHKMARPAPNDTEAYLKAVDDIYVTDAYHSLSIEGYQVSRELIERVRSGAWNPEIDEEDKKHRDALAARGYWQAFQFVKTSIQKVLEGENSGEVVQADIGHWYREMFTPTVTAGLTDTARLAGYRNGPVYIRRSKHVPLNPEAVRDAMPEFFDLLRQEEHPVARIVLGHFVFVFIHPYFDGNGRTARFLMNVMMAAAGLPWTVIRVEHRNVYMAALEEASVTGNIVPFTNLLLKIVQGEH